MMIDFPTGRQTFNFDCGAKALQLVMAYYGTKIREDKLMTQLGCNRNGYHVRNMIAIAEKNGFDVYTSCGLSLQILKQFIDECKPVILLIQAWADKFMTLDDWGKSNKFGHYVIVIGYQNDILVFEDPGSFHRTWLSEEEFIARWNAKDTNTSEEFNRFGMVLQGKQPAGKRLEHME